MRGNHRGEGTNVNVCGAAVHLCVYANGCSFLGYANVCKFTLRFQRKTPLSRVKALNTRYLIRG